MICSGLCYHKALALMKAAHKSSSGLRFRFWGFGFRVPGFGFRVSGFGFRVLGKLLIKAAAVYLMLQCCLQCCLVQNKAALKFWTRQHRRQHWSRRQTASMLPCCVLCVSAALWGNNPKRCVCCLVVSYASVLPCWILFKCCLQVQPCSIFFTYVTA